MMTVATMVRWQYFFGGNSPRVLVSVLRRSGSRQGGDRSIAMRSMVHT